MTMQKAIKEIRRKHPGWLTQLDDHPYRFVNLRRYAMRYYYYQWDRDPYTGDAYISGDLFDSVWENVL